MKIRLLFCKVGSESGVGCVNTSVFPKRPYYRYYFVYMSVGYAKGVSCGSRSGLNIRA